MARVTESHGGSVGGGANASSQGRLLPMFLLAVGLAAGGAVGWAVIGPGLASQRAAGATVDAESRTSAPRERAFYTIENLVVNPAGTRGMRFLVVTIAVELASAAAADELTSRDAEVRDALVRLLGRMTVEELADVERREALRNEIHGAVADLLARDEVVRVYLPLYVIQ
ncbi:MAG: flagellar basal body-associated FliL family protein [Gemmatimonadota bacterium]